MPWNQDAERNYWRLRCLSSFWWFFKYAWGYDFNPKGGAGNRPWLFDETHRAACDWYQTHALEWLRKRRAGCGEELKLIIVVPRDWGKTTLFTQAGQVWLHLHDPELATYTGAETANRAKEVLSGIKSVISGTDRYSRFAWLYGSQKHPGRVWKTDSVVTSWRTNLTRRDASFGTWAVMSGMVGLHPDACFFDDPNTYEQMQRKADWLHIVNRHLDALIPVFQSDALWVLTGTRYGDGDHIGKTLSPQGEGCRTITGMPMPGCKADPEGIWHVFFMDAEDDRYPARDYRHYVMPRIWSRQRIRSFKRRNISRYYAQVRNNPTMSPTNLLTNEICDTLMVTEDSLDFSDYRLSLHFDTAFRRQDKQTDGDFSVISQCLHKTDGSGRVIFVGAEFSNKWTYNDFGKQLIEIVRYWEPKVSRIACMTDEESIGKPGIWEAWLRNLFRTERLTMPRLIFGRRNTGRRKTDRIREAAGHWISGRMRLMAGAPGLSDLIEQMVKIGLTEYDDIADATSDAFQKEVYTAIFAPAEEDSQYEGQNPFDDVLKPGRQGDLAAEEIAEAWEEQRQLEVMQWDVVAP